MGAMTDAEVAHYQRSRLMGLDPRDLDASPPDDSGPSAGGVVDNGASMNPNEVGSVGETATSPRRLRGVTPSER